MCGGDKKLSSDVWNDSIHPIMSVLMGRPIFDPSILFEYVEKHNLVLPPDDELSYLCELKRLR